MRIQHNIMAMNAYRNYTNNVAAMKSNLEKLSSGYKINRAGDDAAGLAISEKMRAQITGLQTAQKNAKDGISLVQTAEGALTEVHDMLNRMVELATQSANGTYDNETDRAQMQKELDQLKSEINRIADSSNFNGIKLLDGSMDSTSVSGVKYEDVSAKEIGNLFTTDGWRGEGEYDHPAEVDVVSNKGILETEGGKASKAGFEINLDGTSAVIKDGGKFELNIAGATVSDLKIEKAGKYTSSQLAAALDGKTVTINDANGDPHVFTAKADGKKLIFTTDDTDDFKLNNNAGVTWTVTDPVDEPDEPEDPPVTPPTPTDAYVDGTLNNKTQDFGVEEATAAQYTIAAAAGTDKFVEGDKIIIGTGPTAKTYTVVASDAHAATNEVNLDKVNTAKGFGEFYVNAITSGTTPAFAAANDFDFEVADDGKITMTAINPGAPGTTGGTTDSGIDAVATNAAAVAIDFKQADGTTANTNVTFAATPAAVANTGTNEVTTGKVSVRISKADNDAIIAAADAKGITADGDIAIKKSANGSMALFVGDTAISADVTYATGNVEFKDADGNLLVRANVTGTLADADFADSDTAKIGTAGIDTGLSYVAATDGTAAESGLMALDGDTPVEDDTGSETPAATAAGIQGEANSSIAVSDDATDGTAAVYTLDLSSKGESDIKDKAIDGVTISWDSDLDASMSAFVTSYNETSGKAYEASWDADSDTLTLTAKEVGAVTTGPETDIQDSGDAMTLTATTPGADATPASKTVNASTLDKNAIETAVKALETAPADNAKVTIAKDADSDKLVLKVGDTVIGKSTADAAAGEVTFTANGEAGGTALGKITLTGTGIAASDFATAVETGLSYKAAVEGEGEGGGSTTTAPEGSSGVNVTETLKDLSGELTAKTELTADQAKALNDSFKDLKITIAADGALGDDRKTLDLTDVAKDATSIGEVAQNILTKAQALFADNKDYEVEGVYADAAFTKPLALASDAPATQADTDATGFYVKVVAKETETTEPTEVTGVSSGSINKGLQNVTDNNSGASAQLANTAVDFDRVDAWQDGAKITIGDTTYTVALGQNSKFKDASNVIDMTDMETADKKIAAQRLTVAAKDNKIFSVGHDGNGVTTLQQRSEVKESTDMTTDAKIASYLGVSLANADSLETAKPGRGLTLQIGDTADSYNKLTVSIKDMHSASLGLDDVNIADQDDAAAAIEKIKAAINTVSDVRGTLGATQNRLDHTINNLSVMTENIQDAESTIRDTDVAEEMMAYTKNNILIQSAQAMLAQANQVPQGVLQLLG